MESAILALAGQPFETLFDEPPEAVGEIVPAKEFATFDPAAGKILDLRYLLDQAVAGHEGVRGALLVEGLTYG